MKPRNWTRPKTWVLPLTYKPKIPACKAGTICQTIRPHWKMRPGDTILFHDWAGKPYYSKWNWRARVNVTEAHPVWIYPEWFERLEWSPRRGCFVAVPYSWSSKVADELAAKDGIDPPTGKALGELLCKMHDLRKKDNLFSPTHFRDIEFQVIRWKNWHEEVKVVA